MKAQLNPIGFLNAHTGGATKVALSPNATYMASSGLDHFVRIWDLATKDEISHAEIRTCSIAFSRDGNLLAVGDNVEGNVRLYSVPNLQELGQIEQKHWPQGAYKKIITAIAFSATEDILAIGRRDGIINLWDLRSNSETASLIAGDVEHPGYVYGYVQEIRDIAFTKDGLLLAACVGKKVTIWELGDKKQIFQVETTDRPLSISFSPDGKYFAVGFDYFGVALYDAAWWTPENQRLKWRCGSIPGGFLNSTMFTPDGRLVICGGRGSEITLCDASTGKIIGIYYSIPSMWKKWKEEGGDALFMGDIASLDISTDGKLVVSAAGLLETCIGLWALLLT